MLYVSYLTEKNHERSGWIQPEDLENDRSYVNLVCEDAYGGARAIIVEKSRLLRRAIQKPAPIGQAYFGTYLCWETKEVIGYYVYNEREGLVMYNMHGGKIKITTKKDVN